MDFLSPGMEPSVAPRLFLTKNVSCRDVTPFRAAGCVAGGASGCKCSFQMPLFIRQNPDISFLFSFQVVDCLALDVNAA